ncbi:HAMP domain-containing sensor histidine kinase [Paenibacillus oralis]|uniref:histidine kinase n=1 Tax=Paenibacillus oralis TaxID=2490856 RepID=A0A3P3U2I6_9BACL|nr:HAMP domain-containing sensor histidine kinase [Paenibacillus oralis]RRJ64545.1 HAMP domain-containing sensor histidine kinase [Paenibacillus oralis]
MRRNSVVYKLFVVTSLLILLIFSLVMLAESLYFERFYRTSKIGALERNMKQLAQQINGTPFKGQRAARLLGAFMNDNDASAFFLNGQFERKAVNPYFLELLLSGTTVTVPITPEGMTLDDIPHGIQVGERIIVDGIFMDEEDTIMQPAYIRREDTALEDGLVRVQGKVTDMLLPENRSYNPLYQDTLADEALKEWVPDAEQNIALLQEGRSVRTEWRDKWSGLGYAVIIQPLPVDGSGIRYLFVMASLQPVGEAVGILRQYFVYAAPVILVLVLLLSFFYSRIISRPLVALSRSAARLAELDFTAQPEIRAKDEFGELSRSLTALSRNLDATLKQLRKDMIEKERSEQLRKELIANLSHELKTPLGIVKGFAEGLQDGVASDKRERYLALIVKETDRMNELIMDMLELSKYEAKAIRLHPRSVPLPRLIQKAADSFTRQLENKHLQIKLNGLTGEEAFVTADPRRLEQVVLNLLSNAIRHAVERTVITIDIKRTAVGTITVVLENAGAPLAEEDLSRIWDHFYRAERSRDRLHGGTGLGLAIVKHILELHHSEYGARNTYQGVAFYFTLKENGGYYDEE